MMADSKQIEDAFIVSVFKELGEAERKLSRWNPASEPWHYWSREAIENALRCVMMSAPFPDKNASMLELYADSYASMAKMGDGTVNASDVAYDIRNNMIKQLVVADKPVICIGRLETIAAELLECLKAMVAETVEYATINKLGDPEQQHNIKWARSVIAKAEPK